MNASAEWTEVQLGVVQAEAAEEATTVGEFQHTFRIDAIALLNEGADADLVYSQIDVIAVATKDQAHLAITETDTGVLGYNTISAGDAGARMSQDMYASITTMDEALVARQAAEHEKRHGEQVPLWGDIVFKDKLVTTWMLFEGDAEIHANEQVGWGPTVHRPGQPADYAEAQDMVYALQQVVGKEFMSEIMTKTGDTPALQRRLDELGLGSRVSESEMQVR